MITSAALTASATSATRRPASSATARLFEPGLSPTTTSTPGFVEVPGVGVALRAIADDRDRLPREGRGVRVVVVVHLRRHRLTCLLDRAWSLAAHARRTPVRNELLDPVAADERDELVDLGLRAGHLDDDRLPRQVDDPALRQLDELQDLGPVAVGGPDLDERQLLGDDRRRR